MNSLISKTRKPKFELVLKIIDLNNVPLVSGIAYVKWHLPSSTSAEHRGRTNISPIKEHKVTWNYEKTLQVRLSTDKSNLLQECLVNFEIIQEYNTGARGDKITLGNVNLNLAEYVEGDDGEEGITRRYLMQESKINSTLKVGIIMKQIDGERNFIAPPLRTAPVFGGIAGIVAGEQGEQDEYMPSISKSHDAGELQDMYRRTLAASWLCQAGELPADQCIEDIFSGGDGWRSKTAPNHVPPPRESRIAGDQSSELEEERSHRHSPRHHRRMHSGASGSSRTGRISGMTRINSEQVADGHGSVGHGGAHLHRSTESPRIVHHQHGSHSHAGGGTSTGSIGRRDPEAESSENSERGRSGFRRAHEVGEFDVREDLIAWRLPGTAAT